VFHSEKDLPPLKEPDDDNGLACCQQPQTGFWWSIDSIRILPMVQDAFLPL
jgi:hypothetical protein